MRRAGIAVAEPYRAERQQPGLGQQRRRRVPAHRRPVGAGRDDRLVQRPEPGPDGLALHRGLHGHQRPLAGGRQPGGLGRARRGLPERRAGHGQRQFQWRSGDRHGVRRADPPEAAGREGGGPRVHRGVQPQRPAPPGRRGRRRSRGLGHVHAPQVPPPARPTRGAEARRAGAGAAARRAGAGAAGPGAVAAAVQDEGQAQQRSGW
mmetsp:Transcript_19433/g.53376  ORF Transcript_19433/g.53376 Transcript_19433/m.53376 type:complete len:206 (+) Transcript_19433:1407-2024(+)